MRFVLFWKDLDTAEGNRYCAARGAIKHNHGKALSLINFQQVTSLVDLVRFMCIIHPNHEHSRSLAPARRYVRSTAPRR